MVAYGATDGSTYSMPIKSRDFKDIKKINCKDTYEVYQGTTKIAISYEPADFESTVKWSKGDENFSVDSYDSNAKINLVIIVVYPIIFYLPIKSIINNN